MTFFENDSGLDQVTSTQYANTSSSLAAFSGLAPAFSKLGYTFAGWSTLANGSGSSYANGAAYNFANGSMNLYAQWTPSMYVVNYLADGGSVATTAQGFTMGSSPLSMPTPTFAGYTFNGWYSAQVGGVLVGYGGSLYTPNSSVSLYAQWTASTYLVSYVANGGIVVTTVQNFITGSSPLILPTPTFAGYTFNGWYTASQGGQLLGPSGAYYTPDASLTLYAQWTVIPTLTVTFAANGAGGGVAPIDTLEGSSVTAPAGATFSYPGYVFEGWNTTADGLGQSVAAGSSLLPSATMTLYAQWRQLPIVTISFEMNGASQTIAPLNGYQGEAFTLPRPKSLARPGYSFLYWVGDVNGSSVVLKAGASIDPTSTLTLVARWRGSAPSSLVTAIGPFRGDSTSMTRALASQLSQIAALITKDRLKSVVLYGYSSNTGSPSHNMAISLDRAQAVARQLHRDLAGRHVGGVVIRAAGEGSVAGLSLEAARRVEVFVR